MTSRVCLSCYYFTQDISSHYSCYYWNLWLLLFEDLRPQAITAANSSLKLSRLALLRLYVHALRRFDQIRLVRFWFNVKGFLMRSEMTRVAIASAVSCDVYIWVSSGRLRLQSKLRFFQVTQAGKAASRLKHWHDATFQQAASQCYITLSADSDVTRARWYAVKMLVSLMSAET